MSQLERVETGEEKLRLQQEHDDLILTRHQLMCVVNEMTERIDLLELAIWGKSDAGKIALVSG